MTWPDVPNPLNWDQEVQLIAAIASVVAAIVALLTIVIPPLRRIVWFWPHRYIATRQELRGFVLLPVPFRQWRQLSKYERSHTDEIMKLFIEGLDRRLDLQHVLYAVRLGFSTPRESLSSLPRWLRREAELYADRGQGLTVAAVQFALSKCRFRPVLIVPWPTLIEWLRTSNASHRALLRMRWRTLPRLLPRKPLLIFVGCPPPTGERLVGDLLLFDTFLGALRSQRIPFLTATLRYRLFPEQKHTYGWTRNRKHQVLLKLSDSEMTDIAVAWSRLAAKTAGLPPPNPTAIRRRALKSESFHSRQLFALLALLWRFIAPDRPPITTRLLREYRQLSDADRNLVLYVALGQSLHIPTPVRHLELACNNDSAERAQGCYGGILRRDYRASR